MRLNFFRARRRISILALIMLMTAPLPARAHQAKEKEPNGEPAQASALPLNQEIQGFVNEEDDEDWYALTIPAPGLDILVIEVSGVSGIDFDLTFYDAKNPDDELVEMDVNEEGGGEKIVRMKQRPGKYLIKVSGDESNPNEAYTLRAGKPTKPPASSAEVAQALRKALDFLVSKQKPEGNFDEGHIGKSGLALMAILSGKCTGKDYSKNIRAGLSFLESEFDADPLYEGGPKAAWSRRRGFMYSHAIATLTVIEALVELKDTKLKGMAEEALQVIIKAQNTEHKPKELDGPMAKDHMGYGGWRYDPDDTDSDLSVTGWQILALRAAKNTGFEVPDWSFDLAARYVRSLYAPEDGSFEYRTPDDVGDSCARAGMGALSLQLCGYPDDPCVKPALRFMQDHAPTWNFEEPGDGYPFYYWYYGTRAMLIAGGDDWRIWKEWTCRMLVDNQNSDGSWDAAQDEESVGTIYSTALGAMILGFCCGHWPAYMPKRAEPASLRVVFEKEAVQETARNVELILDASNSMWGQIGGEAKIAIARRVLGQIIEGLPETMNVGLRVYGHRYGLNDPKACTDTELLVPIRPVEKARLIDTVNKIQLKGKTPLVHSVLEAIKDFAAMPNGSIILVTDGIESCGGDIKSIGPAVKGSGLEIKVHIVGFDITAAAERQELETIARSTEGTYIDARDAASLLSALRQTLQAEFVVLDAKGKEVARGAVGGPPVELRPGDYTLRVLLPPQPMELKITLREAESLVVPIK